MTASTAAPHGAGRFAPSPSGQLHVGNLRTALLAWLFARSTGRAFLVRIEDLDSGRSRDEIADIQLAELAELGLDWDGEVVRQSARHRFYQAAIDDLAARGLVYECYCSRKEILAAPSAPHTPQGAYPGICRDLPDGVRRQRRTDLAAAGRAPALRLRSDGWEASVEDVLHGEVTAVVDDLVLRRGDGCFAYNLAVVVDDGAQGIDQVVRGDDLLTSAPRQAYLAGLLGLTVPQYAHVPLALGPHGQRLAKRDGDVTLERLARAGVRGGAVLGAIARSLGLAGPGERVSPHMLVQRFDPAALPRAPWVVGPDYDWTGA